VSARHPTERGGPGRGLCEGKTREAHAALEEAIGMHEEV
jgi:hypothetical protein